MVGAVTHACARDAPLLTNCVMSDCVPLFGGLPGCFLALPEGLEKGPLRLGGDTAASRSSSSGPACTRPQRHPHGKGAERYRRHCSAERHSPLELNQHDPVLCAKDNLTLGPALCARARHTPRPHASSRAPFSHAVGHGQRGLLALATRESGHQQAARCRSGSGSAERDCGGRGWAGCRA